MPEAVISNSRAPLEKEYEEWYLLDFPVKLCMHFFF